MSSMIYTERSGKKYSICISCPPPNDYSKESSACNEAIPIFQSAVKANEAGWKCMSGNWFCPQCVEKHALKTKEEARA